MDQQRKDKEELRLIEAIPRHLRADASRTLFLCEQGNLVKEGRT